MKIKNARRGFSLVELLVVVTIIAILSVTAFVALGGQTVRARDSKRQQDLTIIQSSLEHYFLEFSRSPASLTQGEATVAAGWLIPKRFLSRIPEDPNSTVSEPLPYLYNLAAGAQSYEIAATLEKTGIPSAFETYIIGNTDPSAIATAGGRGRFYNTTIQDLSGCGNGLAMDNGVIGESAAIGNCIPYDPR